MKHAADLCWKADEKYYEKIHDKRFQNVVNTIAENSKDLEIELNWLYNNLAAFAVYYLAIGILIKRNPERFLVETPQERIIELIQECGVQMTPIQIKFIGRIENAFAYTRKQENVDTEWKPEELQFLKQDFAAREAVSREQKVAMDDLFKKLATLAKKELLN